MKKMDVCLIAGALLLAATLFASATSRTSWEKAGMQAEIYIDGQLTQTIPLPKQAEEITIQAAGGYNTLALDYDGVRMIAADCASRDCVYHAKITRSGAVIACLPHRLIVKLIGAANSMEGDVDIVAG